MLKPGRAGSGISTGVFQLTRSVPLRYPLVLLSTLALGTIALRRLLVAYVPPAQRLRPADVLIVLGHPANADGSPGAAMVEEVTLAASLYHSGLAPALLFTGGPVYNEHVEAQVMAHLAVQMGVPWAAVATETQARDTVENARYCRQIMQARGWLDAIVITTPYHVRRASRIFRLAGIPHQMAYPTLSYQQATCRARLAAVYWDLLGMVWLTASQWFGLDPSWWAKRRCMRQGNC